MFDKTGTLTVGKPVVVNTRILKNMTPREFYELVAATEVHIHDSFQPKSSINFKSITY